MPIWLLEIFCPEHGLPILLEALCRYWSVWQMGMHAHKIARIWARRQWLDKIYRRFCKGEGIC